MKRKKEKEKLHQKLSRVRANTRQTPILQGNDSLEIIMYDKIGFGSRNLLRDKIMYPAP